MARKKSKFIKNKTIKMILILIIALFFYTRGININNKIKIPYISSKIEKLKKLYDNKYKVVYISDGDTIRVKKIQNTEVVGNIIKIRLYGIDAPEISQDYGLESKEALQNLIKNKEVRIVDKGTDRYGRMLGIIYIDNINVNEEMVKNGYAWWYEKYDKDNIIMKQYEENAKSKRLGIFSKKGYISPWEFRKKKQAKSKK